MSGGAGVDFMGGGPGDDTMNGQADADVLCGDGYEYGDTLNDGGVPASGVDKLWNTSAAGSDACTGTTPATMWDQTATSPNCPSGSAYHLFSRPDECPE
jgi:hypothetical protein